MAVVGSQALRLERFLEREGLVKKPGALLAGLGAKLQRASELPSVAESRDPRPTGLPDLDRLLAGGLQRGGVVELIGRRSSGRHSIGLAALAGTTSAGEAAALVDLGDHLDPQAAEAAGVDLTRVLWVRPRRVKEALAAAEMLLATGFSLVVADLGIHPRGTRFLPDAVWVRLARSAQSHGASLLLLTPWRLSGIAADAVASGPSARPMWEGTVAARRLLSGVSARVTLDKLGRETPGRSASVRLSMPDAVSSQLSAVSRTNRAEQAIPSSPGRGSRNAAHVLL